MDVTGLLISLLLAAWTPALALRREFHFFNVLKNWTDAHTFCRENLLELASIRDANEWARAREVLLIAGNQSTWIAMYDDVDTWRWSIDNSSLREEGRPAPESYLTITMNNAGGFQQCGVWVFGKLADGGCTGMGKAICYNESTNSYVYANAKPTWEETRDFCRSKYTDLAMARTPEEKNNLKNSFPHWTYWIGLHREGWKWSDQSDTSFQVWTPGAPSGITKPCAFALENGWGNIECHEQLPVLCAGPPRQMLKVVMRTKGALDLNDPVVHAAILRQVEWLHLVAKVVFEGVNLSISFDGVLQIDQQLRNNGVHQELRLSWVQQPHGDVFNKTLP